jgi:glyoxylase-like metal-dependent hydrolase (beta-lactamase superfamily II)
VRVTSVMVSSSSRSPIESIRHATGNGEPKHGPALGYSAEVGGESLAPRVHGERGRRPRMNIQHFFDPATWTLSYVVDDGTTGVVIDPVRDYDPKSGRTSWRSSEEIAAFLDRKRLRLPYVIDTHAHADHMSGMPFFKERYGAKTVTGSRVGEVQAIFRDVYGLARDFPVDGRQFDVLLDEGDVLEIGSFRVNAMHTPGHTPAHMS